MLTNHDLCIILNHTIKSNVSFTQDKTTSKGLNASQGGLILLLKQSIKESKNYFKGNLSDQVDLRKY